MNRERFIEAFLGAFAETIVFTTTQPDRIAGTAIYDRNDPNERQNFCWQISEDNLPSESTYKLARLIQEQGLLDIDRITLSRESLRQKFNNRWSTTLNSPEFDNVINELEAIQIRMVDDGKETGAFFMHE